MLDELNISEKKNHEQCVKKVFENTIKEYSFNVSLRMFVNNFERTLPEGSYLLKGASSLAFNYKRTSLVD